MKVPDKKTYGPTTWQFKDLVAQTLHEEVKPVRKVRVRIVVAVALCIVLLGATALAVVIGTQEQSAAREAARLAVMEVYGFNESTLRDSFKLEAKQEKDASGKAVWEVKLLPMLYFDELGEYTVLIDADTQARISVTWTHDDADQALVDSGGWESPAWGPLQLTRLEDARGEVDGVIAQMEEALGPFASWPIEEKEKISQMYLDMEHPKEDMIIYAAPGEGDMQEAEALEIAFSMIDEKYGTPRETMLKFDYEVERFTVSYWDDYEWGFRFFPKAGEDAEALGEYRVEFFEGTLTQELCMWYTDDYWAPVDDLIAMGKLEGVYEKMKTINVEDLTQEQKVRYTDALVKAGYDLPNISGLRFIMPTDADLTEEEAQAAAEQVMLAEMGFTERSLTLMEAHTEFVQTAEGTPVWNVTYVPMDFTSRIEAYRVLVGRGGNIVETDHGLDLQYGRNRETEPDAPGALLGEKKLWTPADIVAMLDLQEAAKAIEEASMGEDGHMTMEALAAHDQLWRDAGFSQIRYGHIMPGDEDITLEEAMDIAFAELAKRYKVAEDDLRAYSITEEFSLTDGDRRVWRLFLSSETDFDAMNYYTEIDAHTGEVRIADSYEPNG